MDDFKFKTEVLIVGAGMAGLTAAKELRKTDHEVLVVDKGRGVGGRLASRRIEGATFDHGAQFMTARDARFVALIDHWLKKGVVKEWYQSSTEGSTGHPHWRGQPAMTAVAKNLAVNLKLFLKKRIVSLSKNTTGWVAVTDDEEKLFANAIVLTPPVPQSLALLDAGEVELAQATRTRLERIEYERCLAVMAVLDGPAQIPTPGGLKLEDASIAWIADNQMKGISDKPAVTVHATAAFSLEHWDSNREEVGKELLQAAKPWLCSEVTNFQVHGWRYSKPISVEENLCPILNHTPPLVLAGDAFASPRVEGAALSGWAAADTLEELTR